MATTKPRGYLAGKKSGKSVKLTHANEGGIAVGDKHSAPSGGISGEVGTEKRPIKFEGREVVITAAAVEDPTLIEYEGKKMTRRQALSEINVSGGGVSFADGGDIPASIMYKRGSRFKVGSETMTVPEIVKYCGCGCAHAMAEGGMTMQSILSRKLSGKPDIYLKDEGDFITVIFDTPAAQEKAFVEGVVSNGGNKVNISTDQLTTLKRWARSKGLSIDDSEIDEFAYGGETRYQIKGPQGYYIRELASGKVHFVKDADQAYFFDEDEAEDSQEHLQHLGFADLRVVPYGRTLIMQELAAGGTLDRRSRDYALLKNTTDFQSTSFAEGGDTAIADHPFRGHTHKYANAYELNKAIEAIVDSVPVNLMSAEDKAFLKYYSGYGGLEKFGATGKGLLYEYYTPPLIAQKMWGLAYKYGYAGGDVLEPAAGIGEFVKYAPENASVTAYEINKYSAQILKILYPQAQVHNKYFEELFIVNRNTIKAKVQNLKKYDLVIGNPPYGEFEGTFAGMGEKSYTRAGNYIDYFIFRGLDLLKPGGLLVFIVGAEVASGGKCFLTQQMNPCKTEIMEKADLLDAYRLPNGVFDRTDVLTDIIVLRKK